MILALTAGSYLVFLVLSAFSHGGSYSLAAWILLCLIGLICLFILLPAPLWIFLWYPAEGFSGLAAASSPDLAPSDTDDDYAGSHTESDEGDEGSYEDDGEQLFDEDVMDDDFDDELGEFYDKN